MNSWRPTDLLREILPEREARAARHKSVDLVLLLVALLAPALWSLALAKLSLIAATARVLVLATMTLMALLAVLWLFARRRDERRIFALESETCDLRLSRVLLNNFLSYFPDLVYFKDRECRFVRISQSHVRHFKLQREEDAWGKTDLDMFTDEHAKQAMHDELEIMRTGTPLIDFEEKETWADGRETWCSTSKLPLRTEGGLTIGTFGVSLDITQRRKAEEAARRDSAERERAEEETRLMAEKLARSNAELTDKQRELVCENEERRCAEEEARLMAEKLARSNAELTDKQRELERENEERKRAEEEARKAGEAAGRERDLLHALMDNIPDLIYFKDAEGRYTRINRAHADALGLAAAEQAAGRSDHDFYAPDFVRRGREEERDLLTSGRASVGRADFDERSGRWYLATKVPLRDKSGQVSGLVGISKDITERKQAEEKLEADLQAFLTVVDAVAQGDLTRRGAQAEDTLGRIARSVNKMLDNFCAILTGVRDAAFSVSSGSSQILAAATQIAKGAQYGSDEVHTTSSAVEEMAKSMTLVSHHAEQSAEMARQVLEHVHEGEQSVNVTVLGMMRIDAAATEAAEKMRLLERRSKQIFDIIALIEEIASQSTLLSLNAAIEAAHAGDAGRGFGVVSEEIRRLADRSTASTKQVTGIVEGIVEETRLVLAAMENGTREVHSGRELSERAQKSLQKIQDLAQNSVALSEQISHASREQAQATQTVSQAMQTISNITHESSAGATETSKAVKDLVALSEQLTRAIERFKIGPDS